MTPSRIGLMALSVAALGTAMPVAVSAEPCSRSDFEAVVGEAAQALRTLNHMNKPAFQAKLRELKAKRGWSHDQFLTAAAPIVQDQKISTFDEQSTEFLSRIEQLGAEATTTATPDCARLTEVRKSMSDLVAVQKAKWSYMFERVTAELSR